MEGIVAFEDSFCSVGECALGYVPLPANAARAEQSVLRSLP
jgi:hypothetical protein